MPQLSIQQAIQLATEHHRAGQLQQAEQLYRQILQITPDDPMVIHLLGTVVLDTGRPELATEFLSRAIAMCPDIAEFHYNMGMVHVFTGRFEQAAECFRRAISLKFDLVEAHGNLVASLHRLGRVDELIVACQNAVILSAQNPELFHILGLALETKDRLDEAVAAFERALALSPAYCEAMSNLGNTLKKMPGRLPEAIAIHQQAAGLRPDIPQMHNNLGQALDDDYQYEASAAEFRKALELEPNNPEAFCGLARAMHRMGNFDEALAKASQAVTQWPDYPAARLYLAQLLLSHGKFEQGWPLYQARWDIPKLAFERPLWTGQNVSGHTLLLYGEQGFGDVLQFARYAPLLAERGAKIILECSPKLIRLMRTLDGVSRLLSRPDNPGQFDFHCPLLNLPLMFNTTLETIPAKVPYLRADPGLASLWRDRIPRAPGLKVGLVWSGNPGHLDDRNRSIPLSTLASLSSVPGVWFCGLQPDDAAQTKSRPLGFEVADFSDGLNDFADTAALIENLDLVISVDTAAAHLAGAMGKPVWTLLPFVPDWRWMLGRNDSPWYPTMKLFRQPRMGDWQTPIVQVVEALKSFR